MICYFHTCLLYETVIRADWWEEVVYFNDSSLSPGPGGTTCSLLIGCSPASPVLPLSSALHTWLSSSAATGWVCWEAPAPILYVSRSCSAPLLTQGFGLVDVDFWMVTFELLSRSNSLRLCFLPNHPAAALGLQLSIPSSLLAALGDPPTGLPSLPDKFFHFLK